MKIVSEDHRAYRAPFISSPDGTYVRGFAEELPSVSILSGRLSERFAAWRGVSKVTLEEHKVGVENNIDAAERTWLRIRRGWRGLAKVVMRKGNV